MVWGLRVSLDGRCPIDISLEEGIDFSELFTFLLWSVVV